MIVYLGIVLLAKFFLKEIIFFIKQQCKKEEFYWVASLLVIGVSRQTPTPPIHHPCVPKAKVCIYSGSERRKGKEENEKRSSRNHPELEQESTIIALHLPNARA